MQLDVVSYDDLISPEKEQVQDKEHLSQLKFYREEHCSSRRIASLLKNVIQNGYAALFSSIEIIKVVPIRMP